MLHFSGFIYVLANPRIMDLYKIGCTEGDPLSRASEISGATGVPEPYEVIAYFPSKSPANNEVVIHKKLDNDRPNSVREFFSTPLAKILETCCAVTGFPKAYQHPRLSIDHGNLSAFDFWASMRQKPHVAQAIRKGNNFLCVHCGRSMRPPKENLRQRGVFRWCNQCAFYVDKSGREVILRRTETLR